MTLQESEVKDNDIGAVSEAALRCQVRLSVQKNNDSLNLKVELWNDDRPCTRPVSEKLRDMFTKSGGATWRVADCGQYYAMYLLPCPRGACGRRVSFGQNLTIGGGRHKNYRSVNRAISQCRESRYVQTEITSILSKKCSKNRFPLIAGTHEAQALMDHGKIVGLYIQMDKSWLRECRMTTGRRNRARSYPGHQHGGDNAVKQEHREAMWLDRVNGLLPEGHYHPGMKIMLMPGTCGEEVRILLKERGVDPLDIVIFEANPQCMSNLTVAIEKFHSGVMPNDHRLIQEAGLVILPDGPLAGRVGAISFDHCESLRLAGMDVDAVMRSGVMAPVCNIAVNYARCHDKFIKGMLVSMGWGDPSTGRWDRHRILDGILATAGMAEGNFRIDKTSGPRKYHNGGTSMETMFYRLVSTLPVHEDPPAPGLVGVVDVPEPRTPAAELQPAARPEYFEGYMDAMVAAFGKDAVMACVKDKLMPGSGGK